MSLSNLLTANILTVKNGEPIEAKATEAVYNHKEMNPSILLYHVA